MNDLMEKYAKVLLETCLKVEEKQPLFISFNIERLDFVRIVAKVAYSLGVTDIYFDMSDPYLKHDALISLEVEQLKELTFWNKEMWNVYAKKNAAFLMLASETPGLMKDVEPRKISEMTRYSIETRKVFDEYRDKSALAWCIAAVPTKAWADELFNNEDNSVELLWKEIFKICSIDKKDPVKIWNEKLEKLKLRANKLNKKRFKTLIYKNDKTNFKIDLPENHKWGSGCEIINNKKEVLVNFPTEEVFTSPDCRSAEGIVFSSKPLEYQGVIIDNFSIEFKNGKVINVKAEKGEETLKEMINICKNADMLGEVALVEYDSPISKTNRVFQETLYDENAACHFALGDSFPECIDIKTSKKELFEKYNMNDCDSHVDFMIGTKDLNIKGITHDNIEVDIFIDGNFTEEFN